MILLAGALALLSLAGCSSSAPEEKKVGEPAAVVEKPAASAEEKKTEEPSAPPVSEAKQKEAEKLAKEAEKVMLDPKLGPKEKYPKSLGMFRDALKIDPNNALAKESIKLIEDIYKSMGRPVPEHK